MHILIVDDEQLEREMLDTIVRKWGHQTATASSCSETLRRILEETFDLILLDIFLPDGFGYEIIPRIRDLHPHMHIVAMTGSNSRELESQVRQSGSINFYMIKPFELKELKSVIDHAAAYQKAHA